MGDKSAQIESEFTKRTNVKTWPLWKKIVVAGVPLLIVIGLAVGLGVGLSQRRDRGSGRDEADRDDTGVDSSLLPINTSNLWQPTRNKTWQIVLSHAITPPSSTHPLQPNVSVFDIDLDDNDAGTIAALQSQGVKVICYFSAGSWEDFRSDRDEFPEEALGKVMDGWPNEKWVNVSSPGVRDVMRKRIERAGEKGCDGIDPDNVDGYQNDNGLNLTKEDAISFIKFLATEAASYNMTTGLKNAGDIIPNVLPYVGFSVNEQCMQYGECETFAAFTKAEKPVFHIEYPEDVPRVSEDTRKKMCSADGFSTVIKKMELDGWVEYCDGEVYETEIEE